MPLKSPEVDHLWFDQSSSLISLKLCRPSLALYTGLILSLTSGGNNIAAEGLLQATHPFLKGKQFFLETTNKCLLQSKSFYARLYNVIYRLMSVLPPVQKVST